MYGLPLLKGKVYKIERGELSEFEIDDKNPMDLDVDIDTEDGPGRAYATVNWARTELPLFSLEALPMIRHLAEHIVPHATVYCAPSFRSAGGKEFWFWGRCHRRSDVILMRTDFYTPHTLETFYHECWHCLEQYLSARERAIVKAATDTGPAYWEDGYICEDTERAARAFGAWALSQTEACSFGDGSWRDFIHRWSAPPHVKIFVQCMRGAVARRAVARRWVRPERLSAAALAVGKAMRDAMAPADRRVHLGA